MIMKRVKQNNNRFLYSLITFGILIAIGVGVYATTYTASGAGHPYTEISTCAANQILKMNSTGTAWECAVAPTGLSSQWIDAYSNIYFMRGNVGIGTMNPTEKLEIAGSIKTTGIVSATNLVSISTPVFQDQSYGDYAEGNMLTVRLRSDSQSEINAFTDGGQYNGNLILLPTGGKVGIGTTSPTEKLQVAGNIKATSFLYSSDKSLKTNIVPLTNSLELVKQLEGVSFNWKENGEEEIGLIAQDVEKVFPELVSGEEGNKAVEYGNLVAVLIEAVKEQQKQIDELKAKLNN